MNKSELFHLLNQLDQDDCNTAEADRIEEVRAKCLELRIACWKYTPCEARYTSIEAYEKETGKVFDV